MGNVIIKASEKQIRLLTQIQMTLARATAFPSTVT